MNDFGLKPQVDRMCEDFIQRCHQEGIEIAITEGLRSMERQQQLYEQGRTRKGQIVTNAKAGYSFHNHGVAFDVIFVVNGKRTYNGDWGKIGSIGESCGLEWGGRWASFKDRPHFQYTAGYKIEDFVHNRVDWSKFA